MKRWDDLTNKEKLALSKNEVDQLIEVEYAHAGLPIYTETPRLKAVKPMPDLTIYQVPTLNFIKREDAKKVMNALAALEDKRTLVEIKYMGGPGYEMTIRPPSGTPEVSMLQVYSPERVHQIKDRLDAYNKENEKYKKAQKEYDELTAKRYEIEREIREELEELQEEVRAELQMKSVFVKYLKLADGDIEVAKRFLKDAYQVPENIDAKLEGWHNDMAHEEAA